MIGFYEIELDRCTWQVPERYKDLAAMARGANGLVCAANDSETLDEFGEVERVAIKKYTRPFCTSEDAKRTYREIKILRHMRHENIIQLIDLFTPNSTLESFQNLYFVSPLCGKDLFSVLQTQLPTAEHVQFLVYQILRALKYIHSAGIIHRDLKPHNIVVNENLELKILDFGLARQVDSNKMTEYVVTRWWRAPEIVMKWLPYEQKADLWSVACIMGELILGRTLFPGVDDMDQLMRIVRVVGSPSDDLLKKMVPGAADYLRNMPQFAAVDFKRHFNDASDDAIDFLKRSLSLDPALRPSAEEALEHPYFERWHDKDDEPVREPMNESLDSTKTLEQWKEAIWNEILQFQEEKEKERLSNRKCSG